jgi:hypothetical protein
MSGSIYIKLSFTLASIAIPSLMMYVSLQNSNEYRQDGGSIKGRKKKGGGAISNYVELLPEQHFEGLYREDDGVFLKIITYVAMNYLGVGHGGIWPKSPTGNFIQCIILFFRGVYTILLPYIIYQIYESSPHSTAMNYINKHIPWFKKLIESASIFEEQMSKRTGTNPDHMVDLPSIYPSLPPSPNLD